MLLNILRSAVIGLVLVSTPGLSEDDVPQASYPGAPDGQVAVFAGEWSAFRPGGESRTLVICGAPVTLTPLSDTRLQYQLTSGIPLEFDVSAGDALTEWENEREGPMVVVWTGKDEFHLHPAATDGEPDWADTMVYHRCPENPQQSYEGAVDGDAEPFIGTWSLSYRASTGNLPDDLLASCDNPIRIDGLEQNYIFHDDPEATSGNIELIRHQGHTDWKFDDLPEPWEVVWITPDRFHAYVIGLYGDTDWRLPFIYERCE